jgi:CubicO group peptidase (beta-lactamase class C family)
MDENHLTRRAFALSLSGAAALLATPSAAARLGRTSRALAEFRARARALGVRALVVVRGGETIVSDGEVTEPMRIASIRKSLLSALFGAAAAAGRVNLEATVGELGIDDYQPLTDRERGATVRQLLMARSGVYIPTAAESPAMRAARPPRGSHDPGTHWYYNNWDFNVLGEIYQRTTGEGLFTAIEHRLARPLGWRDFQPVEHTRWSYDPESPRFPAYNLWMSARDLARFGQLFLRRGEWTGKRIVPEAWVAESTRVHSLTGRAGFNSGYGYMWWVVADGDGIDRRGLPAGAFTAAGNGGRYITVIPQLDLVAAVQPDEKRGQPPVRLYADPNGWSDLLAALVTALT